MRLYRLVFYAVLPLFVFLVACDSGGDNEEEIDNHFELEITEASAEAEGQATPKTERDLSGFSFFAEGTDPETGESAFGLYFNDSESIDEQSAQQGLFGIAVRQGGRPSTGSYSVDFSEEDFGLGSSLGLVLFENVEDIQNGASYYFGTSGTINFNTSSDREVGGSINVEAMRIQMQFDESNNEFSSDTTDVLITGEFTARNAETFLPPGITPEGGR